MKAINSFSVANYHIYKFLSALWFSLSSLMVLQKVLPDNPALMWCYSGLQGILNKTPLVHFCFRICNPIML